LFDLPATSIGGWEVSFLSGHYPVNYKFALKKASPDRSLIFEDENVLIQFMVTQSGIDFIMKNKSVGPIKIDWDQAAYVDVMSKSHKVLHAGVRYMERDKPQAPTIVPPNANVEELIFPTDYVNFVSGLYGGWTKDPLFPDGPAAKPYKGQSFSVFMPIEVRGTIKNYAFDFVIEEVQS
jgi:hypothetical protein